MGASVYPISLLERASEGEMRPWFLGTRGKPIVSPLPVPPLSVEAVIDLARRDAETLVSQHTSRFYRVARNYYEGDHWQQGAGWIGPRPAPFDDPATASFLMNEVERCFTSENVIAEIVDRFARGLVGREPRWALVPREPLEKPGVIPPELQTLITEAEMALTAWWNVRRIKQVLRAFVRTLCFPASDDGQGRSILRIFIPRGLAGIVNQSGTIREFTTSTTLTEALAKVHVDAIQPNRAGVFTDPDTRREIGVALWRRSGRVPNGQGENAVELSYLDASGEITTLRSIVQEAGSSRGTSVGLRLGGRLTIHEARLRALISGQIVEMQRGVNLGLSMVPRALETSGFLARTLFNSQIGGKWEVDDKGNATGNFVPNSPPQFGPNILNVITGISYQEQDGKNIVKEPSMHVQEPTDPTIPAKASAILRDKMLSDCEQRHAIRTVEEANQEQDRADFLASLTDGASAVDPAGEWLLETVLAVGEALMNQPGRYTSRLRVLFTCRPNAGPPSVAERDCFTRMQEKNILSRESVQEAIGVDDVDAENARIAGQEGAAIDTAQRQANVVKLYRDSGMAMLDALMLAGISEEQATKIAERAEAEEEKKAKEAMALQAAKAPPGGPGAGRPTGRKDLQPSQGQRKSNRTLMTKRQGQSANNNG